MMWINFNNASLRSFANQLADGRCNGPTWKWIPVQSCLNYSLSTAAIFVPRRIGLQTRCGPQLAPRFPLNCNNDMFGDCDFKLLFPPHESCPSPPRNGSKRGPLFLFSVLGLHHFSRCSGPSPSSSQRSHFLMCRANCLFRNWSSSSGIQCHLQILPSTYSWCRRTCEASSPPSLLNVFIKLLRSSFIDMIRLLDYAMFPTGQYMKSSPTIGGECSKRGVDRQKSHGSFMRRVYRCSSTL